MKNKSAAVILSALMAFSSYLSPAVAGLRQAGDTCATDSQAPPAVTWPQRLKAQRATLSAQISKFEKAGDYGPLMAAALHSLAGVYEMEGRYDLATIEYKREISVLTHALGSDNPRTIDALRSLAAVYEVQGNFGGAGQLYEREYALWKSRYGSQDMHLVASLHSLGAIAENQSDYDKARTYFAEELSLHQKAFGQIHPANIPALRQLANIAEQKEDYQTAESLYLLELQSVDTSMPRPTVLPANTHARLGRLYEKMQNFPQAEAQLKEAIAQLEPVSDPDDPYIPELLQALARVYTKEGRLAEAKAAQAQAKRQIESAQASVSNNL